MVTGASGGEMTPKKQLVLDALKHFQAHREFPDFDEFRNAHLAELHSLNELVEEDSLQTRLDRYEPTLDGLLKYALQEVAPLFGKFDQLLPYLKEAYRESPQKTWSAEELSQRARMSAEDVARVLGLFSPLMSLWFISTSGPGKLPLVVFSREILDAEPFGDVVRLMDEQEELGEAPRLAEVRVDGYRALDGFEAHLKPLTVVIGANAAGKSSLFDLLAFTSFAAVNPLPPEVDPRSAGRSLFHKGGPERIMWSLLVERQTGRPLRYCAKLQGPVGNVQVNSEQLVSLQANASAPETESFKFLDFKSGKGSVRSVSQRFRRSEPWVLPANELALRRALDPNLTTLNEFREYVSEWKFYSGFDVSRFAAIRRPVSIEPEPVLREDGANLSAVLFHLMTEQQERWGELETHLRSAIPAFQSLNVKSRGGPGTVIGIWREEGVSGELTFADLSDGTLRFLCWATLCLSRKAPLVCIDEPEIGLHPRVLPVLAGLLRQASSEAQLLVATHSPYFLSQFSLEEIAVMKKVDGRAVFAHPASNEALRREIEELGGDLAQLHISDELEVRS